MNIYDFEQDGLAEDLRTLRVRLAVALVFMLAVTAGGTVFYYTIAPAQGWVDALFMTIITLSTVGFGEVIDLTGNPGARLFTAVLIMVGMGATLYFVTTATAFVIEGHLGQALKRRNMEKTLAELSGHMIVCGGGPTAVYAARELLDVGRTVVMVIEDPDTSQDAARALPDVPVVRGDPAEDAVLRLAGLERAGGLIAATENDKENLVVTLSARQINPDVRIVSKSTAVESDHKIRQVGADAVVTPTHIGGLRLASELIRPTVVSFLDIMLRDRDKNLRIDEVPVPGDSGFVGRPLSELELDRHSRALVMAYRPPGGGEWVYNPTSDQRLEAGSVLIVMGTPEDSRAVANRLTGKTA